MISVQLTACGHDQQPLVIISTQCLKISSASIRISDFPNALQHDKVKRLLTTVAERRVHKTCRVHLCDIIHFCDIVTTFFRYHYDIFAPSFRNRCDSVIARDAGLPHLISLCASKHHSLLDGWSESLPHHIDIPRRSHWSNAVFADFKHSNMLDSKTRCFANFLAIIAHYADKRKPDQMRIRQQKLEWAENKKQSLSLQNKFDFIKRHFCRLCCRKQPD